MNAIQILGSRIRPGALLLVLGIALTILGGVVMAAEGTGFGWQGRADRDLDQRGVLKVQSVKKESSGFLGIFKSPSLAGSLPDPMVVEGSVVLVDRDGAMTPDGRVTFRIPKYKLQGTAAGDLVAIGVIGEAVVCLTPVPAELGEPALAGWLEDAPCE